jgi:hypothetical protein
MITQVAFRCRETASAGERATRRSAMVFLASPAAESMAWSIKTSGSETSLSTPVAALVRRSSRLSSRATNSSGRFAATASGAVFSARRSDRRPVISSAIWPSWERNGSRSTRASSTSLVTSWTASTVLQPSQRTSAARINVAFRSASARLASVVETRRSAMRVVPSDELFRVVLRHNGGNRSPSATTILSKGRRRTGPSCTCRRRWRRRPGVPGPR